MGKIIVLILSFSIYANASLLEERTKYSKVPAGLELKHVLIMLNEEFSARGPIEFTIDEYSTDFGKESDSVKKLISKDCWGECKSVFNSEFVSKVSNNKNIAETEFVFSLSSMLDVYGEDVYKVSPSIKFISILFAKNEMRLVEFSYSDGDESSESGIYFYKKGSGSVMKVSILTSN